MVHTWQLGVARLPRVHTPTTLTTHFIGLEITSVKHPAFGVSERRSILGATITKSVSCTIVRVPALRVVAGRYSITFSRVQHIC